LGSTQTGRAVEKAERGELTSAVSPLLSVVIPCLNEADTVGPCIDAAIAAMRAAGVTGEILVVDNGSTDGSQEIPRPVVRASYLSRSRDTEARSVVDVRNPRNVHRDGRCGRVV
jgi:hypothetical protein